MEELMGRRVGIVEEDGRETPTGKSENCDNIRDLIDEIESYTDSPYQQVGLAIWAAMMLAKCNDISKDWIIEYLESMWRLRTITIDENGNREQ
jgi:hypothetical protein